MFLVWWGSLHIKGQAGSAMLTAQNTLISQQVPEHIKRKRDWWHSAWLLLSIAILFPLLVLGMTKTCSQIRLPLFSPKHYVNGTFLSLLIILARHIHPFEVKILDNSAWPLTLDFNPMIYSVPDLALTWCGTQPSCSSCILSLSLSAMSARRGWLTGRTTR